MSDNSTLNPGSGGDTIRTIDRVTAKTQVVTLDLGGAGAESLVAGSVPVSGSISVSNFPATQAISGAVSVSNFPASQAVTGPLTDTQLRASAVPVSLASTTITGNVTVAQATAANLNATVIGTGTFAVQAAQSGTWTVQPGNTANTTPWLFRPSDGTNNVAVKAASTAAAATDPALVVAISPNNTVAATQSGTWNITNISGAISLPTGAATSANQTTLGSQTTKINDGTNTAAVKAASTAAAFTDPALTVDPRPGGAMLTASAALADAVANPTIGRQAVHNYLYNGTTHDLQRGMSVALTTGDTGAKTATGNGATQTNVGNKGVVIVVKMGAVTGTTPTCTMKVQGSLDGGTTWYDIPGATTAAIAATGVFAINIYPGAPTVAGTTTSISGTASCGQPLPRTWRMVWTIGGTTPSFTITNVQVIYIPN